MPESRPAVQPPDLLISNLSLPKTLIAFEGVAGHERYMRTIGADGLELTPTYIGRFMGRLHLQAALAEFHANSPLHGLPAEEKHRERELFARSQPFNPPDEPPDYRPAHPLEDEAYRRLIRSLHSSFRKDEEDKGLITSRMPIWRQSLGLMRNIQVITGPLPAVLYPDFEVEDGTVIYDDVNAPFAERMFQPTAAVWQDMDLVEDFGAYDIKDMTQTITSRGFTGLTWDTFHSQRSYDAPDAPGGCRFQDPLLLGMKLAAIGLVSEIHLSLDRLDITGLHGPQAKATRQARRAFVRSADAASRTLEGEMLQLMLRTQTSHPSTSIKRIVLEDGPIHLNASPPARDHAAIIAHTRELIDAVIHRFDTAEDPQRP